MTSSSPPPREAGFTLVELMVSLLVFGMIAAASALLLATAVDAQTRVAGRLDRSSALRRTAALMTADFAQATSRPTRAADGTPRPAFAGGDGQLLAALVRGGWDNPDGDPRPALQRIDYRLAGDTLTRTVHARLDGAGAETPLPLLTGVAAATMRFRDDAGWRDRWDAADPLALPRAVELTLTFADGRILTQRWQVAS